MTSFDTITFNEALSSETPVFVDFWASWCSPCMIFAPVFEELSEEFKDSICFGKVDIDAHGDIASNYAVTSIPTLILFKDGEEKERIVGVKPKEMVAEILKKYQ